MQKQFIKNSLKLLTIGSAMLGLNAMAADAGMGLGLVIGASIQNPSVTESGTDRDVEGKTALGGGVTFEIGMREGMGFETGLLYLSHKFSRNTTSFFGSDVSSTITSGYLEVPLLIRYRPIPYVNLGIGGYLSRVISSWTVGAEGFGDATADYGKNDYGLALALGTNIPVSEGMSVIADLRYTRSLTDAARGDADALKFSDFQALAGMRFGF